MHCGLFGKKDGEMVGRLAKIYVSFWTDGQFDNPFLSGGQVTDQDDDIFSR